MIFIQFVWFSNIQRRYSICNQISTLEDQHDVLFERLPRLLSSNLEIRLIVLDSITALFRSDMSVSSADVMKRAPVLFQIASHLRRLSADHNLAVVVGHRNVLMSHHL